MGFGYNPKLIDCGERLDILSFFTWMGRIQNTTNCNLTIFDASAYMIVNKTPKKKITLLGEKPSARDILDVLIEEQDNVKRSEITYNCNLRSKYLNRCIEISNLSADYIDSRVLFRNSENYAGCLDIAMELVEKIKYDRPGLISKILPNNPNPAAKLYLPLEIAEALYFSIEADISTKFGPKTEEFFDQAILLCMENEKIPYKTIRCDIGPKKAGYLSDNDVITTCSTKNQISKLMKNSSSYAKFVTDYIVDFSKPSEDTITTIMRIQNELKIKEVL